MVKSVEVSDMTVSRLRPQILQTCKKTAIDISDECWAMAFAQKHQHWTPALWGKFVFSDESIFQQFVVRKKHICRPPGKRCDEKDTISTMKHPPSQMIWSAFSENNVAGLIFFALWNDDERSPIR